MAHVLRPEKLNLASLEQELRRVVPDPGTGWHPHNPDSEVVECVFVNGIWLRSVAVGVSAERPSAPIIGVDEAQERFRKLLPMLEADGVLRPMIVHTMGAFDGDTPQRSVRLLLAMFSEEALRRLQGMDEYSWRVRGRPDWDPAQHAFLGNYIVPWPREELRLDIDVPLHPRTALRERIPASWDDCTSPTAHAWDVVPWTPDSERVESTSHVLCGV